MSERIIYGAELSEEYFLTTEKQLLGKYLTDACKEHANKTCMVDAETKKSITYGELLNKSHRTAELLRVSGASIGSVVGIVSENTLDYPSVLLATLNIGAILSCMDPKNTRNELLHLFELSKPSIIITTSDLNEKVESVRTECDFVKVVIVIDEVVWPECCNLSDLKYNVEDKIRPTDTAVIIHTSGSTGLQKGVMISHKTWIYLAELYKAKSITTYDRVDNIGGQSAVYYPYGFYMQLVSMVLGKKYIRSKCQTSETTLMKYVETFKINALSITPQFATFLAKNPQVDRYNLSSIKILTCTGDLLQPSIKEIVRSRFECNFFEEYGMTEIGAIISEKLLSSPSKIRTTGHLVPGMMAKIVDPQTQEALEPFQTGEFCVKGPSLFNGYCGAETIEDAFDSDGWFHTGDLAFYDNDEDICIMGRIKQLIVYRTAKISPTEIEMLILQHPDVMTVGVVGIPHELDGERPRAYVVKKRGSDVEEEDIIQLVASNVSWEKHLYGGVKFVDELPKTGSGKIDRKTIKQWFVRNGL